MIKNFSKIFALILTLIFSANYYAQCTGCTVTNPTLSGNYTFASKSVVCFTSNATLADVTFGNNSKICVAPGVTVIIQNNVTTTSGNNVSFEVGGTLQFNNPPTINANLTVNVQSTGTLKSGSTGQNNFSFNGTTNTLTNNGTVQVGVLQFNNNNATNIIDNYGTLAIGSNINISGSSTTFRNWNLINIGQSFNMNSSTTYINCGTISTSTGFNVGGGRIINTGNFTVSSGDLDLPDGSRFENYGIVDSRGSTNNYGTITSVIYNEGLVKFNTYQGDGWLKGPSSTTKKGYFEVASQLVNNSAKVGPNLDFKRTNTSSSQSTVFNSTPTYVDASGASTTQALANVTFDCRAAGNCTAPLVTNLGLCPNFDGTFPPQANDDTYTIAAGTSGSTNVLSNDFAQYNGAAATTSNVSITQVSTTNTGVNVNASGIVSVAAGTPAGTYTIVYRICNTGTTSCDTATVTVTVPLDSDGDGVPNAVDLDDDNDGILDTAEGQCVNTSNLSIDGFDSPLVATINGNNIQSVNPYNGWGTETGGANAFNVIRVNGLGYSSGPDVAQSGTQYIDINASSAYVYKDITLTTPTVFSASAWFANRETSSAGYAAWSSNIQIRNQTTSVIVAQGNTVNLTAVLGDEYWYKSAIAPVSLPAGTYRIRMFVGDFGHLDSISYCFSTDTDGDGTPNYLDTDSDNDGCPDATEAAAHLPTPGSLTGGSNGGSSANLGTTVNANGIPTSAATSASTGQATTAGVTSAVRVNAGTTPPATQIASAGTTVTLTSNATAESATTWGGTPTFAPNYNTLGNATAGLTYSWTKNGTPIGGATSATLTLTGVTAADAGTYVVTIKHPGNYCGASRQTVLTVSTVCFDQPNNGTGELPANHGITTLQRAGTSNGNWPMVRTGAWTVLESKTKGFVITRMTTLEIEGQTTPTVILSQITNPQEGMMVYDKTAKCLKIYSDSAWKCFETPACP